MIYTRNRSIDAILREELSQGVYFNHPLDSGNSSSKVLNILKRSKGCMDDHSAGLDRNRCKDTRTDILDRKDLQCATFDGAAGDRPHRQNPNLVFNRYNACGFPGDLVKDHFLDVQSGHTAQNNKAFYDIHPHPRIPKSQVGRHFLFDFSFNDLVPHGNKTNDSLRLNKGKRPRPD
jgi:hypothetical protein